MKNHIILLMAISSLTINSQVGIGTPNPTATLDILSNSNLETTKALEVNDVNNNEIFSVFNNGNLAFKGALMPNGNPGVAGQYLVSKGSNTPEWKTLSLPENSKLVQDVFNTSTTGNTTNVAANTWRKLVINNINLAADPAIGSWNSTTNEFTVVKPGLYFISAGVEMFTSTLDANDSGSMRIHSGGVSHEFPSLSTQCFQCTPILYWDNCNGERVVKLNAGDRIWVEARTIRSWQQSLSFLQIRYSEL